MGAWLEGRPAFRAALKGFFFRASLFLVFVFFLPVSSFSLDISGYFKSLYHYSRDTPGGKPYWRDLSRARWILEESAGREGGPRARAHIEYDDEWRAGTYLRSADYRRFGLRRLPSYANLEQENPGRDVHYAHRLYRAWGELEWGPWRGRFGRQRVAWGSGKLWNPVDVLSPVDPTSLESGEREGLEAAALSVELGLLGRAELAYALARNWAGSDLLARLRGHLGEADIAFLGGKTYPSTSSWAAGGEFSSNLWEGNLHGEWLYAEPGTRRIHWKGVVGYEYTFPAGAPRPLKDAWLLGEYFHNGAGERDPRRYNPAWLLAGRDVSMGRDYAGLGFKKDLNPLWKLELYAVRNLRDRSAFLHPALSWNAAADLHLTAGWQCFTGKALSEFGPVPNRPYLQGQYYF